MKNSNRRFFSIVATAMLPVLLEADSIPEDAHQQRDNDETMNINTTSINGKQTIGHLTDPLAYSSSTINVVSDNEATDEEVFFDAKNSLADSSTTESDNEATDEEVFFEPVEWITVNGKIRDIPSGAPGYKITSMDELLSIKFPQYQLPHDHAAEDRVMGRFHIEYDGHPPKFIKPGAFGLNQVEIRKKGRNALIIKYPIRSWFVPIKDYTERFEFYDDHVRDISAEESRDKTYKYMLRQRQRAINRPRWEPKSKDIFYTPDDTQFGPIYGPDPKPNLFWQLMYKCQPDTPRRKLIMALGIVTVMILFCAITSPRGTIGAVGVVALGAIVAS